MNQQPHKEMTGPGLGGVTSDCDGIVRRNGWTCVDIDAHAWRVPSWKCDKCGAMFWSYFDTDNGDEGYDMDEVDD